MSLFGTWLWGSGIGVSLALAPVPASAADDICSQLAAFHRASFDQTVEPPGRRWIELHWRGHWMDFKNGFGKECRSSPDVASKTLCRWISENSSTEFPVSVPIRVLRCYGYQFPAGAVNHWDAGKSNISVLSEDRWLLLEIDLLTFKNDTGAIRLSSFAKDQNQWTVEMPPLTELTSKFRD